MSQQNDLRNAAGRPGTIFFGWSIVFTAMVGLSIGPGQFAFSSLGLVMVPLGREFGWTRTEISVAFTILTVTMAFAMPAVGALVDRFGTRRIVIPSLLAFAVLLGLMSTVSRLWHVWVLFALIGSIAAGANSLPFLHMVSAWFTRRRGLALGIALMGNGIGSFYASQVVRVTVATGHWRTAYLCLGATVLAGTALIAWRAADTPADKGLRPDGGEVAADSADRASTATTGRIAVLRMPTFWLLFLIFAVLSFSLYGLLPHLAPMLIDRGIPPGTATSIAGMVGISSLSARALGGYLLDRLNPRWVTFACVLLSALGVALMAVQSRDLSIVWIAVVLTSIGLGAEMDLLAYLTGRYFGLRQFGRVYGVLFMSLLAGTALGPVAFGYAYERLGSYAAILGICGLMTGAAALATFLLPSLPALAHEE